MHRRLRTLGLLLAVTTAAGVRAAQHGDTGFVHDKADQGFVQAIAADGVTELDLSALAERQAVDLRVRRLAQQLAEAHARSQEELLALARAKGIAVSAALDDARLRDDGARLHALQGRAFDREYLAEMIRLHESHVEIFTLESEWGLDAELKAWAAQMLPSVRAHMEHARAVPVR